MRWVLLLGLMLCPTLLVAFGNNHLIQSTCVPQLLCSDVLQRDSRRTPQKFRPCSQFALGSLKTDNIILQRNNSTTDCPRKRLTWEDTYQLLCEYKRVHGHCNVPQSEKPLGPFVNRQRIEHARFMDSTPNKPTSMTLRRKEFLEEIGFVWDNMEQTWQIRYNELCEFRNQNGHTVVPRSNGPLGAWVEKQRIEYKKYKALYPENSDVDGIEKSRDRKQSTTLTKERIQKLNTIGFVYDVREKQFEQRIGELRIFRERHGHIDPRFMNGKLALWVRKWEQQYRLYLDSTLIRDYNTTLISGLLPESRRLALESVGFSADMFDEPRERTVGNQRATWEERYEELVSFRNERGHCMVQKNYGPLGSWVRAQRHLMKEKGTMGSSFEGGGILSQDRIESLDRLNFVWDVHHHQWNTTFQELLEYKNKHNDTNVPMSHGALGLWVFNQRAHYNNFKKGKTSHMTDERAELLLSIGFEFDLGQKIQSAAEDRWESKLFELKQYNEQWGTFSVQQSRNPSLYNWCQRQKACYRAKLNVTPVKKAREEALKSIGFIQELESSIGSK